MTMATSDDSVTPGNVLLTEEDILAFFLSKSDGEVSNNELVSHFRAPLKTGEHRAANRRQFPRFVNNLATVRVDPDGRKTLTLKKKFRHRQEATSTSSEENTDVVVDAEAAASESQPQSDNEEWPTSEETEVDEFGHPVDTVIMDGGPDRKGEENITSVSAEKLQRCDKSMCGSDVETQANENNNILDRGSEQSTIVRKEPEKTTGEKSLSTVGSESSNNRSVQERQPTIQLRHAETEDDTAKEASVNGESARRTGTNEDEGKCEVKIVIEDQSLLEPTIEAQQPGDVEGNSEMQTYL